MSKFVIYNQTICKIWTTAEPWTFFNFLLMRYIDSSLRAVQKWRKRILDLFGPCQYKLVIEEPPLPLLLPASYSNENTDGKYNIRSGNIYYFAGP